METGKQASFIRDRTRATIVATRRTTDYVQPLHPPPSDKLLAGLSFDFSSLFTTVFSLYLSFDTLLIFSQQPSQPRYVKRLSRHHHWLKYIRHPRNRFLTLSEVKE